MPENSKTGSKDRTCVIIHEFPRFLKTFKMYSPQFSKFQTDLNFYLNFNTVDRQKVISVDGQVCLHFSHYVAPGYWNCGSTDDQMGGIFRLILPGFCLCQLLQEPCTVFRRHYSTCMFLFGRKSICRCIFITLVIINQRKKSKMAAFYKGPPTTRKA